MGDNSEAHQSRTIAGAKLFIVDWLVYRNERVYPLQTLA